MKVCLACAHRFEGADWTCPLCQNSPSRHEGLLEFAPSLSKTEEGFDPASFSHLFQLEAGNFWFRARNRLIIQALDRFFPKMENFLEIGCGTGYVLSGLGQAYPKLDVAGSEISVSGLHYAQKRLPNCRFFQMDARQIPFDQEFDVIGAFDVLEHIDTDEIVLQQVHQAVAKKGGIILTVPQHQFLWGPSDTYAHHVRRYAAKDLTAKLKRAGFEILSITSFVSLLFPALLFSRFCQRRQSLADYDPTLEINLPPWLNWLLEQVMNLENKLIGLGICFPLGGSLLVVAQRTE